MTGASLATLSVLALELKSYPEKALMLKNGPGCYMQSVSAAHAPCWNYSHSLTSVIVKQRQDIYTLELKISPVIFHDSPRGSTGRAQQKASCRQQASGRISAPHHQSSHLDLRHCCYYWITAGLDQSIGCFNSVD